MSIPAALVKTWLDLANNNDNPEVSAPALDKLLLHFGNIDIAELYVKNGN